MNFPGNAALGPWTAKDFSALMMGHEIAHRNGIDIGTRNHINANASGLKQCGSIGRC